MNLSAEHIGKKLLNLTVSECGIEIGLIDGVLKITGFDVSDVYFKPYINTQFSPLVFSGNYDIVCDRFYFIPGEPFEFKRRTCYYIEDDPNKANSVIGSFDMNQKKLVSIPVKEIDPILDWNETYCKYENCFGSFYAIAPLLRKELGITRRQQSEKYGYHVKSLSRLLTRYRKVWNIFELNREWVGQQKIKKVS